MNPHSFVEALPLDKKLKDLISLSEAITELDNIRAGYFVNPRKIDDKIGKVRIGDIGSKWKVAKKQIFTITSKAKKRGRTGKYIVYSAVLRIAAILSLGLIGISFLLAMIQPQRWLWLAELIQNPFLVVLLVIVIPNSFLIVDYLARHGLREDIMKLDKGEISRIKQITQELMDILAFEASKQRDVKLEKLRMKLFFNDYNNIRVVKKPGLLRKAYIVEPVVKR